MAYFEAKNLQQNFETVQIDVSFECEKGTMTSIVGPSGSGKSTVLRLISGLNSAETKSKGDSPLIKSSGDRPLAKSINSSSPNNHTDFACSFDEQNYTNGDRPLIKLDQKDITNTPPAKRNIGMVFQSHSLFDHLKVEDNVAYGLISSGMKKKEARQLARDFLKQFGLEGFEKRYPTTLSGGEAQRVALARTLIMKPKLVLFDEPLSALDAPLRKKLAALIRDLQKTFGFTGIMVTHDIAEAKTVSDKIILMKNGKIIWQGASSDFNESLIED